MQEIKRCSHTSFKVKANVFRLVETEDDIMPTGFAADITINCIECGMPFEWLGVERGASYHHPMKSASGLELRAPITPVEEI